MMVVFSGWSSDRLLWREGLSGLDAPLTPVRVGLHVRGAPVRTGGLLVLLFCSVVGLGSELRKAELWFRGSGSGSPRRVGSGRHKQPRGRGGLSGPQGQPSGELRGALGGARAPAGWESGADTSQRCGVAPAARVLWAQGPPGVPVLGLGPAGSCSGLWRRWLPTGRSQRGWAGWCVLGPGRRRLGEPSQSSPAGCCQSPVRWRWKPMVGSRGQVPWRPHPHAGSQRADRRGGPELWGD